MFVPAMSFEKVEDTFKICDSGQGSLKQLEGEADKESIERAAGDILNNMRQGGLAVMATLKEGESFKYEGENINTAGIKLGTETKFEMQGIADAEPDGSGDERKISLEFPDAETLKGDNAVAGQSLQLLLMETK